MSRSFRKLPNKAANVYTVLEAMGWNRPAFLKGTPSGYMLKYGVSELLRLQCKLFADKLEDEYGVHISSKPILSRFGPNQSNKLDGVDALVDTGLTETEASRIVDKLYASCRSEALDQLNELLDTIYDRSGIRCSLTPGGFIVVPFAQE